MTTNFTFPVDGVPRDFDEFFVPRDLFSSGGLWTWGLNITGHLGDGTTTKRSSPVQTVAGGSNWKQLASFQNGMAAIKTDGTLWMWGYDNEGELGDNAIIQKSSPVQTVAGGTNWKQVSAGIGTVYAIKTDGTLWAWGTNTSGQVGDNSIANKSSPVQTVSGGANWKTIAAGGDFASAIKTDGTLWTWGNNAGNLGDNTIVKKSSPVQTVSGGTNWKMVAAGYSHTLAIKTDGTLWTWGYNYYGQLGDSTVVDKSSPIQTIASGTNWKQVSGGSHSSAAIKSDGTLWLWGYNTYGGLGNSAVAHKSSPVQTVSGGTNWKQVAVGYTTMAIKTDGTLWTWGLNNNGQLGDSTIVRKSSPVQTVAGGTNWKMVNTSKFRNVSSAITDSSL
jgi:alpha-tubulin suppressor-like RCC1 family protein